MEGRSSGRDVRWRGGAPLAFEGAVDEIAPVDHPVPLPTAARSEAAGWSVRTYVGQRHGRWYGDSGIDAGDGRALIAGRVRTEGTDPEASVAADRSPDAVVGPVAQGGTLGCPAATQQDLLALTEIDGLACFVEQLDIAFDHQRAACSGADAYGIGHTSTPWAGSGIHCWQYITPVRR